MGNGTLGVGLSLCPDSLPSGSEPDHPRCDALNRPDVRPRSHGASHVLLTPWPGGLSLSGTLLLLRSRAAVPCTAALCPGQPVLGHRVGLPEARAGGAVLELGTEGGGQNTGPVFT